MQPLERMAAHIAAYRSASEHATPLTDVTTNKVAAYTLVHVTDNNQSPHPDVWRSVGWWYSNLAEFTLQWELPHLSEKERESAFPLLKPLIEGDVPIERFDHADMIVIGDTERCIEKMKHYADLGVDELICYVQFGYLPHEAVMRTVEVLGKEVIPELAAYRAQTRDN
jgi:alkanesulfonate monooxygenase SsuD/methylene tetrahydromethanopterin reductase-like flavin-dependent oxidoreductase (luciferase family)